MDMPFFGRIWEDADQSSTVCWGRLSSLWPYVAPQQAPGARNWTNMFCHVDRLAPCEHPDRLHQFSSDTGNELRKG